MSLTPSRELYFQHLIHKSNVPQQSETPNSSTEALPEEIESSDSEVVRARRPYRNERRDTQSDMQSNVVTKQRTLAPFAQLRDVDTPRRSNVSETGLSSMRQPGSKPGASSFRPTNTLHMTQPGNVGGVKRSYQRVEEFVTQPEKRQKVEVVHNVPSTSQASRVSDALERMTIPAVSQVTSMLGKPASVKRRRALRPEAKEPQSTTPGDGLAQIGSDLVARKEQKRPKSCQERLYNKMHKDDLSEDELARDTPTESKHKLSRSQQPYIPIQSFVYEKYRDKMPGMSLVWNAKNKKLELWRENRLQKMPGKGESIAFAANAIASVHILQGPEYLAYIKPLGRPSLMWIGFGSLENASSFCKLLEIEAVLERSYNSAVREQYNAMFAASPVEQDSSAQMSTSPELTSTAGQPHMIGTQKPLAVPKQPDDSCQTRNANGNIRLRDRMRTDSSINGTLAATHAQAELQSGIIRGHTLQSIKRSARQAQQLGNHEPISDEDPVQREPQEPSLRRASATNTVTGRKRPPGPAKAEKKEMGVDHIEARGGNDVRLADMHEQGVLRRVRSQPSDLQRLDDDPSLRRSKRNSQQHTVREKTPPPPALQPRWTRVNSIKPWSQPVVYPLLGTRRVTVEFQDLERLDEGEFLNDTLISFALRRIEDNVPQAFARHVHFFNSYFYSTLCSNQGMRGFDYEAVKRWTKNTDLLGTDFVVVPINHDFHWFAAIICNLPVLDPDPAPSSPMLLDDVDSAEQKLGHLDLQDQEAAVEIPDSQEAMPASDKKSPRRPGKKRSAPPLPHYDPLQPAIITLDSFGTSHTTEVNVLRRYIGVEVQTKRQVTIDTRAFRGITGRGLVEQNNFCDCGLFLIAYLETFAKNPRAFVSKLLNRSMDAKIDFQDFNPSRKRAQMREELLALYAEQETLRVEKKSKRVVKSAKVSSREQDEGSQHLEAEPARPFEAEAC